MIVPRTLRICAAQRSHSRDFGLHYPSRAGSCNIDGHYETAPIIKCFLLKLVCMAKLKWSTLKPLFCLPSLGEMAI